MMYEELITGLLAADLAAGLVSTAALWKKIDGMDRRLTTIEAEHNMIIRQGGHNAGARRD